MKIDFEDISVTRSELTEEGGTIYIPISYDTSTTLYLEKIYVEEFYEAKNKSNEIEFDDDDVSVISYHEKQEYGIELPVI